MKSQLDELRWPLSLAGNRSRIRFVDSVYESSSREHALAHLGQCVAINTRDESNALRRVIKEGCLARLPKGARTVRPTRTRRAQTRSWSAQVVDGGPKVWGRSY